MAPSDRSATVPLTFGGRPDTLGAMADLPRCPCLVARPVDDVEAATIARLFRALADPARVRLLSLLAGHPAEEACVSDLLAAVALAQPTVSHHLKVLHEAGLVQREKRGSLVYYRVERTSLAELGRVLG